MLYDHDLRMRADERSDLPHFVRWMNDPEVVRHLLIYLPLSMEQEEKWFANLENRPPEERPLAVEICDGDRWRLIGNAGFNHIDWHNREGEVGIVIGEKSFWNRGIGRRVMTLLLRHGFDTLNLNRVFLRVNEDNTGGIRAYEAAGFVYEGRLRQANYHDGSYHDMLIMSVLQSEWKARKA